MPVESVKNDTANKTNLYAGIGAGAAGFAGAAGGYCMAPRAVKTLDELVFGSGDVFDKTLNNMRKKNAEVFGMAMQTIFPARVTNNSLLHLVKTGFTDEKVPAASVREFVANKEEAVHNVIQGYDEIINSYKARKDSFTLNELYDDMLKRNVICEEDLKNTKPFLSATLGEAIFDAPVTMSDELSQALETGKKNVIQTCNMELNLYKKFLNLEKDGVILKTDMLETVKQEVKSVTEPFLQNVSFDSLKKFVPKKGAVLWAAAAGIVSAGVVGGAIKLFYPKKSA